MAPPPRPPTATFLRFCECLNLGEPPLQIDLLLQLSGVEYELVRRGAIDGSYGEVAVRFISLLDLIVNKRAAGREKDLADVKALEAARDGSESR